MEIWHILYHFIAQKHPVSKSQICFPQEAFNKRSGDGDGQGGADVKKRIHVRSKDPMRIARQMEKKMEGDSKKQRTSKGRPPPPQMKVNTICKVNNS